MDINLNIASTWKRILGGIIDVILVSLFFFFFVRIFGKLLPDGTYHVGGFLAFIMFLVIFLYYIVLEATTGKTVGKYIAKTKVVNAEGAKITWGQSIGRNLMRIVDGLFAYLVAFIAIISSKNRQRLGDMVAKTYVIKT